MGLSVKNKRIIFVVLLLLLACMNSFLLIKFINPRWSAKVSLLEGEEYLSNVFTEYEEPGVQVKVGEKIIKDKDYSYKVEGTVNKDQVGDYILTYKVKYKNKEYTLKRKVTVVDTIAPEINTSIASIEKDFCTNQIKQDLTF